MLQIKPNSPASIRAGRQLSLVVMRDQALANLRPRAANILRLLILALVGLLFILVSLMILTGRVEIGAPFVGGVLLIGFGAAQFGRSIA
jgi:hypothetical protein